MPIDPRELRRCLGHFATGVTVVTCRTPDGGRHGATVNAFTAVSLDPALVLVSLNRRSTLCALMANAPFTVNVLERGQRDVALHFAGRPRPEPIAWAADSACGAPRLAGCLATVSCTSWREYDGGDHVLYLGEVDEVRVRRGRPLLFHGGQFHDLHTAPIGAPWDSSADAPGGWYGDALVPAARPAS